MVDELALLAVGRQPGVVASQLGEELRFVPGEGSVQPQSSLVRQATINLL